MNDSTNTPDNNKTNRCACGCGESVRTDAATFVPGHDARFAGKAIRLVVDPLDDANHIGAPHRIVQDSELNQDDQTLAESGRTREEYLSAESVIARRDIVFDIVIDEMGRPLLAHKIKAGVNRQIKRLTTSTPDERKERRAAEKERAKEASGIKIGRWTYPAKMTGAGKVLRNTKRDGSGEWIDADLNRGELIF